MPLIYDFLSLVISSIGILASHHSEFVITLGAAFILAGLGWYGAANYSKLWNLQFRTTVAHAALCFVASILAFVFVVLFASFSHFFESEGLRIPGNKVVEFTAEALKEPLHEGTARVVPVARSIIVALFLLVQLVPFGLIGWAAWRDLKVTV